VKYKFEKYYPFVTSILLTIVILAYKSRISDVPSLIDKIADNGIGLATTLVGFFLTILTIINSIETRRMDFVRSKGLYPTLIKYLNQSIRYNAILIASSFLVKYIDHRSNKWLQVFGCNIVDYLYLYSLILTLMISLRFTNIFVRLLADPKDHA
jgi:hypothetical protein